MKYKPKHTNLFTINTVVMAICFLLTTLLHKYIITKPISFKSQILVNKENSENLLAPVFSVKVVKAATVLLLHLQKTESRTGFQLE